MPGGTTALLAALDRLEESLARQESPARWRALGEPTFVGLLLEAQVRRLVRMGPALCPIRPGELLRQARRAAAIGVAPHAAAIAVRHALDEAAQEVKAAGAWRRDRALWWQPLPRPARGELLWRRLDGSVAGALPDSRPPGLPESRWLLLPELLPASLCERLFTRLESLHAAGALELEPGRVGGMSAAGPARSDEVRLLTGFEEDLLARLPDLAVVVQWCRERLAPRVASLAAKRALFAPHKVLLARYPAPSAGFRPHLDNPGGAADNGRGLTAVLYLNPAGRRCAGGELALWRPGADAGDKPDELRAVGAGSLAVFDARAVRHAVRPLEEGPPRWSIAVWLNEAGHEDAAPQLPILSVTEVLLPVESPPLARRCLLRHELDDQPSGRIVASRPGPRCRAGVVSTVAGEGDRLIPWCRHHLDAGFVHLVLVFDDATDPAERRLAKMLRNRFPAARLTVWSSAELRAERWPSLAHESGLDELLATAAAGHTPQAVASRQALNATAALAAARTDELGGQPLDWLLHLDADELFYFHGPGRGGAQADEHFSSLARDGIALARYLNHELLLPMRDARGPRFKRNPRLAAARLGPGGWRGLSADLGLGPDDRRPYFHGYQNGKSAVAVAIGRAAAGVHGWSTSAPGGEILLAGPSVLHFHFASVDRLARKLLAMAASGRRLADALFEPCRSERAGLELVRSLLAAGADSRRIRRRLASFRDDMAAFRPEEEEILAHAGLLLRPRLDWPLPVDRAAPDGPAQLNTSCT